MQERIRRPVGILLPVLAVLALAFAAPARAQTNQHSQAGQFDEVLKLIRPLAESGNAQAQFVLGGFYSQGQGVPQDEEQAALWWRKAAEQGMARAQNELGVVLSDGRGVPADPQQAVAWYRKAAEQGLAVAQANLGLMYWKGIGVRQDDEEAIAWYRKAAEQGFGWAEYYLGNAYVLGRGLAQDQKKAAEWLGKAAEKNYTEAQYALGRLYWRQRNPYRATYWFARAAQHGHELAERELESIIPGLSKIQLSVATEVRDKPDAGAAVIRTAGKRELAYVLDRPRNWVEVYLEDGHTVGYISAAQLRGK